MLRVVGYRVPLLLVQPRGVGVAQGALLEEPVVVTVLSGAGGREGRGGRERRGGGAAPAQEPCNRHHNLYFF